MGPIYFTSDQKWIARARTGDRIAFSRLVERYGPRVYHLLRQLSNNADLAEDLTQETFIAAYTAIDSWRGEGAFSSWLCGIAVKRYREAQRRSGRQPIIDSLDLDDSTAFTANDDPLAHYQRREAEAALAEAISALSDICRDVFVLVRVEEMPYQAVADMLEIPIGTVFSRMNRATKFLHQRLAPLIYGTEPVVSPNSGKGANHDI